MKVRRLWFLLTTLLVGSTVLFGAHAHATATLPEVAYASDNAYLFGAHIDVPSPVSGDVLAFGSAIRILATVGGDALIAGNTLTFDAPVSGDVRAVASQIVVTKPITGEFAGVGGLIQLKERAGAVRVAGGTVELTGGSNGPVTVYGNKITLGGVFAGPVRIVAADSVTLAENTVIAGTLEYNAPQEAFIPASAEVSGGARYIGSASFLPTPEEARAFAIAGFGVYFIVRVVAGMLVAGLVAGLFPRLTRTLARETLTTPLRHKLLLFIIGFAALFGIPILLLILLISIVGIGIGFLLGTFYVAGVLLSYVCTAIVLGALIGRVLRKRTTVSWHDAVLGVVALYLIGLVPGVGFLVTFVLLSVTFGALLLLFYRFAFPKNTDASFSV